LIFWALAFSDFGSSSSSSPFFTVPEAENAVAGNAVPPEEVLADDVVDTWRGRWADAQRDTAWVERQQVLDAKRKEVLPEIESKKLISGHLYQLFTYVSNLSATSGPELLGVLLYAGAHDEQRLTIS
jgi:hypothetical protein